MLIIVRDASTKLYFCADGTWSPTAARALRFQTAQSGVTYLQGRRMAGNQPELVWKAEGSAEDWVMWKPARVQDESMAPAAEKQTGDSSLAKTK